MIVFSKVPPNPYRKTVLIKSVRNSPLHTICGWPTVKLPLDKCPITEQIQSIRICFSQTSVAGIIRRQMLQIAFWCRNINVARSIKKFLIHQREHKNMCVRNYYKKKSIKYFYCYNIDLYEWLYLLLSVNPSLMMTAMSNCEPAFFYCERIFQLENECTSIGYSSFDGNKEDIWNSFNLNTIC